MEWGRKEPAPGEPFLTYVQKPKICFHDFNTIGFF